MKIGLHTHHIADRDYFYTIMEEMELTVDWFGNHNTVRVNGEQLAFMKLVWPEIMSLPWRVITETEPFMAYVELEEYLRENNVA